MANASAEKYLSLSKRYLEQAHEMLKNREHAKASEMFWGATTETVKALAAIEEVELKSHGEIWEYVARLSEETGDKEILKLFHVANSLKKLNRVLGLGITVYSSLAKSSTNSLALIIQTLTCSHSP